MRDADYDFSEAMATADALVEDSLTAKCGHWVECLEICVTCNRCLDCCECGYWLALGLLNVMSNRYGYLRDRHGKLIGNEHELARAVLEGRWPVIEEIEDAAEESD